MTDFWILIWIFSTMYAVRPGRRRVTAQSLTDPPVFQPDKELLVGIWDSATLRCCMSQNVVGIISWFKQPNRNKPQIIVTVYKSGGESFHKGFQQTRFRIERSSNCFNLTITNFVASDEAMYYCAVTTPNLEFADGTYLKMKGGADIIASETSKPAVCDGSVVYESTTHGNTGANINREGEMIRSLHSVLLGLGTALGLCSLLIICLTWLLLTRKKCQNSGVVNTSIEDSSDRRQEQDSEDTSLTYKALQFSMKKAEDEKTNGGSSDKCVYSEVNKTVTYELNDS